MAVDNDNFAAKLALRRHFLRRYHPADGPKPFVFDACQATGQLWSALRGEFVVDYFGVDVKLQSGRLRTDSARVLARPGWEFDVIDIDTYGTPWIHWEQVIRHGTRDCTVFLTLGHGRMNNTPTTREALLAMGMGRIAAMLPASLSGRLFDRAVYAEIARAYVLGWRVVECQEAPAGKTARYFGVRLARVSFSGSSASRVSPPSTTNHPHSPED